MKLTIREAQEALMAWKKIRGVQWDKDQYIYMTNYNQVVRNYKIDAPYTPNPFRPDCSVVEWELYVENPILNSDKVSDAFNVLKNAIKEDDEYAYGWHANIAMSCHDANTSTQPHKQSLDAANNAASKFMKLCFGVETSQYMLRNKSSSD